MTMHRDLPEAVEDLRGRVERLEAMIPKTVSPSSPVVHENTGGDMGGLRTERVTLEITHYDDIDADSPRGWNWAEMMSEHGLGINGSVRVVPEPEDRKAQDRYERLRLSCDKIERERDALAARVAELERDNANLDMAAKLNYDQYLISKARVAELESQLESVACRAATAETALEAAPEASGWLTGEEQQALKRALELCIYYQGDNLVAVTLRGLLSRNAPPKVVLPKGHGGPKLDTETTIQRRDRQWIAALAAAGVECKS